MKAKKTTTAKFDKTFNDGGNVSSKHGKHTRQVAAGDAGAYEVDVERGEFAATSFERVSEALAVLHPARNVVHGPLQPASPQLLGHGPEA